jgi:hypothetical protein
MKDEWKGMLLGDAVNEIMRRTNWPRRRAKRWLLKQLAAGNVRSRGRIGSNDGPTESLPKEFWQGQFSDNEGDVFDTTITEH